MADKAARGTKRTCQSGACGQRFYDLNRDPITCPICGTHYVLARGPAEPARDDARRGAARKPEAVAPLGAAEAPEVEAEDALADVEGGDEALAAGDDETFLEEEEDEGGDVSGILGGGAAEDEET
jgi:uncharacterized protein (TIGR02300 family)